MNKINFPFIFDDDFERVVNAFSESHLYLDISLQNIISNVKFLKANRFDEENSEFSFLWKNYYEIKVVVENCINKKNFKTYTFKSININKLPIQMSFKFNFYLDSVNKKTIFILELEYNDAFFTELIKNDFKADDILIICKKIEQYLIQSIKGLEYIIPCVLDTTLAQARKYITNPKLFFQIISKEIFTYNDHDIFLDEKYELFTKEENSSDIIPLTILYVDSFIITDLYIKVIYKTYKKISFPNIRIIFIYKELSNKTTYNYVSVKTCEPVTHEASCKLLNFWKKRTTDFISFFEKKPKKIKQINICEK